MENYIIAFIVLAVVTAAALYLYKAKKRGETCVGCPYAKNCGGHCHTPQDQSDESAP